MKKVLINLLPFEKYEIVTDLSKEKIFERISAESDSRNGEYIGLLRKDKFIFAEKTYKHSALGRSRNSFAPVAVARLGEKNGKTLVSVKVRMPLPTCILFFPMYVISVIFFLFGLIWFVFDIIAAIGGSGMTGDFLSLLVLLPPEQLLLFFAFKRPAKKLKALLETILGCI